MCGRCPGLSVDQDGIFLGVKYRNVFLIYGKDKHETSRASASPQSYQWGLVPWALLVANDFYSVASKCAARRTLPPLPKVSIVVLHRLSVWQIDASLAWEIQLGTLLVWLPLPWSPRILATDILEEWFHNQVIESEQVY